MSVDPSTPQSSSTSADYRASHATKGRDYDADLEREPFERYMKQRERGLLEAIVSEQFPNGVPRYLDFACGTGRITSLVEPRAHQAYGIDVSASMLAVAREKCQRTTFIECDVTRDSPSIEPVDLMTAFRFFGNAQQGLRQDVLRGLSRLLKPGGLFVLNNHRNPAAPLVRIARWRGERDPADLHPDVLEALLNDVGIRIEQVYGVGVWFLHHRLARNGIVDSPVTRAIDRLANLPGVHRVCPDYVLVCRRAA